MFSTLIAVSMLTLVSQASAAKAPQMYPPAWGEQTERTVRRSVATHDPQSKERRPSRHHSSDHHAGRAVVVSAPSVSQLQADISALRKELDAVRRQIGHPGPEKPVLGLSFVDLGLWGLTKPSEKAAGKLFLPGLGLLAPQPEGPSLPSLSRLEAEAADRVRLAREYLAQTATPGYTMTRLSPEVSIGRLHPAFVIKLQQAIKKARETGLEHAGIFSAFRPPIFGVGGFSNKYDSMHSYGLAVDMTGIGAPGSKQASIWQSIVRSVGLFLPYGSRNRSEWNHTQLLSSKVADTRLHKTITPSAPKDLRSMWLASGVRDYVPEEAPVSSAHLLPENSYP